MNQITKSRSSRPASTEAVTFTDGMLVTSDDLNAAMHYPLSVVQVLLRSYLGCGIVCGLEVSDPNRDRRRNDNPDCEPRRGYNVEIAPGVALGCDGYPIELCEKIRLNLAPDPCGCPIRDPVVRFIAIRRESAPEAAPRACGCGPAAGEPGQQCTRRRDHVLVEVFDSATLPKGICMQPRLEEGAHVHPSLCECMRHCSDCDRCAEPWVLLALLEIDGDGIVAESIDRDSLVEEHGRARLVKPAACICAFEARLEERLQKLEKRIPAPAIDVPKEEVNPATGAATGAVTGAVTRPVVDEQGGART